MYDPSVELCSTDSEDVGASSEHVASFPSLDARPTENDTNVRDDAR